MRDHRRRVGLRGGVGARAPTGKNLGGRAPSENREFWQKINRKLRSPLLTIGPTVKYVKCARKTVATWI